MIEKLQNNLKLISTFMVVYFTICGTLWHIGYWSTFNINILQYITVVDLIKSFIFPFLSSGVFLLFGYLFTSYVTIADNINNPQKISSGKWRNTRVGKYLNKNKYGILTIYFCLISIIFIYGSHPKWILLPFLIAIPMGIILSHRKFSIDIISHPDLRNFTMVFFVCLPLISFGLAKYDGLAVRDNIKYRIVSDLECNSETNLESLIGFKYLGEAGNKIFLTKRDNSEMIMLNNNTVNFISIKSKE